MVQVLDGLVSEPVKILKVQTHLRSPLLVFTFVQSHFKISSFLFGKLKRTVLKMIDIALKNHHLRAMLSVPVESKLVQGYLSKYPAITFL